MGQVSCLIFDFGNVICYFDHQRACRQIAALSDHAISADEVYAVIFQTSLEAEYDRGQISTEAFLNTVVSRLGLSATTGQLAAAWSDIFWANDSVIDIAARLKERGFRLILASN